MPEYSRSGLRADVLNVLVDPFLQLGRRRVLADVVVGAACQGIAHEAGIGFGGEYDDRGLFESGISSQGVEGFHAAHFRHMQIEDDEMGFHLAGEVDGLAPIERLRHPASQTLEHRRYFAP